MIRCRYCKRRLTNPDSILRGCGPVCAAKHGIHIYRRSTKVKKHKTIRVSKIKTTPSIITNWFDYDLDVIDEALKIAKKLEEEEENE